MRRLKALVRSHPGLLAVAVLAVLYFVFKDHLPHLDVEQALNDVSSKLGNWTYLLVAVLAFLETGAFVGLIFPGETAVLIAGAVAGQGTTSILLTIAIVWFSAWAGDTASFFIGRRLGREFILRNGPRVRITHERFEQVERYFASHGGKTILIGRFIGLIRALAPFVAGSSGMRYRAFVPFSVLGTGLWATAFSLLGYFLSSNIGEAGKIAGRGIFAFGAVVAVVLGTYLFIRFMRESKNRSELARRMEEHRALRPLVAFGRGIEPQARFLWHRLTPGDLGLELTTLFAVAAVASFVLISYAIVIGGDPGPTPGDVTAFRWAGDIQAGWLTDVAKALTFLGSSWVTVPLGLVAAGWLWRGGSRAEALTLVAAVALSHIGVGVLKEGFDRPRPEGRLIDVSGSSFPSGHATYSVLYPALAVLISLRLRQRWSGATPLLVGGIVLAGAIGLTRVYLHVHYLSDVSAGWGLGTSCFALCGIAALVVGHLRDNPRRA